MTSAGSTHERPLRVLIAKPGLDGHDVGARLVCRALRDAGMEVVYTGLRQTPDAIAAAAVQEAVDVVGLSVLSGAHVPLAAKVLAALRARNAPDLPVVVGGNIPPQDVAPLRELGVTGVCSTGAHFATVVDVVRKAGRREH